MYKQGSDVTILINLFDSESDSLLISSLSGYGIEIFNPSGISISKYGTLDGYTDGVNKFKVHDDSGFELNLSQTEYGSLKGKYTAEVQISYTDADYADGNRNLYSPMTSIFIIGTKTTENECTIPDSTTGFEFTFNITNTTSMKNIYGPYDTPADAYNDDTLPADAMFYLSGDVPGTTKNQILIKKSD